MIKITKKVFLRSAFIVSYLFIFISSTLPSSKAIQLELDPNDWLRADYIIHFSIFGILTLLFHLAFGLKSFSNLIVYFFTGGLLAVFSEYIQKFVSNRTYNVMDLYYNLAGVVIISLIIYTIQKTKAKI